MTREEAKEIIEELYISGTGYCPKGEFPELCEIIIKALEQKPRWIPVSERLPKGYCLFCDIDGDVFYGHIYDKKWWAEGQDNRIKNVIAWMPLPKPYEPKESEEV